MERGGYGGGDYRGRRKGSYGGRGRGGGGPPRGGGRWFQHQPQPQRGRSWSGEETRRGRYGSGRGFHHLPQPWRGQSGTASQPRSCHRGEGAAIGGRGGEGGPPRGGGGWFYDQPQPARRRSWAGEETRRGRYGGGRGFHHLPQRWRGQSGTASQPRSGHRGEGAAIGGRGGEEGPPRDGGGWFYDQPQPERRRSWAGEETRRGRYGDGLGLHHLPQPQRGQSGAVCQPRSGHKEEGAEIGVRGREKGGGRAHGGGSSIWPPTGSDHPRPLPSDPVLELGRPQDQQRSTSSYMLEAKDKILPVHRPDKGGNLANGTNICSCMLEAKDKIPPVHQPNGEGILSIGTDRFQVELRPECVTLHYNVDWKYRPLWCQAIGVAGVVCEAYDKFFGRRKYL